MRLLYITQLLPFPSNSGGKIKTFSTLSALSREHSVHLVAFVENRNGLLSTEKLRRKVKLRSVKAFINPIAVEKSRRQQAWVMLQSLATKTPYSTYKFWQKQMNQYTKNLSINKSFDCVWIDHLSMAQYLPEKFSGLKVLETHNVESLLYKRHAFYEKRKVWKLIFNLESFKYEKYQKKMLSKFDYIFAISHHDKKIFERYLRVKADPKSHTPEISVLPPAIAPKYFHINPKHKGRTLLFTGLLTWHPNKAGVIWFITEVLPLIRKSIPSVKCIIVGEKSKRFPLRSSKGTRFTGYVKSVMPYFAKGSVFIVPLLFGSGIRIKILEAMAAGIPVVSTTIGAEGIPVTNNKHILLANTPEDFAKQVTRLFKDIKLYNTLSRNGKKLIKSDYTQPVIYKTIKKTFTKLKKP